MTEATDSRQSSVASAQRLTPAVDGVLVDGGQLLVGERRAGERVEVGVELLHRGTRR